jgi:hypothetical protein
MQIDEARTGYNLRPYRSLHTVFCAGLSAALSFSENRMEMSCISVNSGKHDSLMSGQHFTTENMIRSKTNKTSRKKIMLVEERMNVFEDKISSVANG